MVRPSAANGGTDRNGDRVQPRVAGARGGPPTAGTIDCEGALATEQLISEGS